MKSIVKGLIMSLISLIVAYVAIALPFRLFSSLEGIELRALFLIELGVYFVLASGFLAVREKRQLKMKREKQKRLERRERFRKAYEEYYDFAA